MGREIKRVALDFDWPIGETWEGFLNPFYVHSSECPACSGGSYAPSTRLLYDQWYGNAFFEPRMTGSKPFLPDEFTARAARTIEQMHIRSLLSFYGTANRVFAQQLEQLRLTELFNSHWMYHLDADDVAALIIADRLWDFTRTPRTEEQREVVKQKVALGHNSWLPEDNGYVPTPAEVNRWSLQGLGHDSINCSVCVRAKAERLGYAVWCSVCEGEGSVWDSLENKQRCEAWEPIEPPEGAGYQLWETVSEGSPMSPVFASSDELANWLVTDQGYSPQAAKAFVGRGWALSMVGVEGVGLWDGVTYAGIREAKEREHSE